MGGKVIGRATLTIMLMRLDKYPIADSTPIQHSINDINSLQSPKKTLEILQRLISSYQIKLDKVNTILSEHHPYPLKD